MLKPISLNRGYCLSILFICISGSAIHAQYGICLKLGISSEQLTSLYLPVPKAGLYSGLGFSFNFPIANKIFILNELVASKKIWGVKYQDTTSTFKMQSGTLCCIEESFIIGTKTKINRDNSFVILFTGTYVSLSINGSYLSERNSSIVSNSMSYTSGNLAFENHNESNLFKRIDTGIKIGFGYEYKSNCLSFQYQRGIRNLSPDSSLKRYSQIFVISFSYRFA